MTNNPLLTAYFCIQMTRQPGESLELAVLRRATAKRLSSSDGLLLIKMRVDHDGILAAKLFLPAGTELRTVCSKCGLVVAATVRRREVFLLSRTVGSLEMAKRHAIDVCECARKRITKFGPQGRRILDFWETEVNGTWMRLSNFRMPWS